VELSSVMVAIVVEEKWEIKCKAHQYFCKQYFIARRPHFEKAGGQGKSQALASYSNGLSEQLEKERVSII
jgi:hypothetical protein